MIDFRFSVGDKVRVVLQSRLKEMVHELGNGVIPDMVEYGGLTATVTAISEGDIKPFERYYLSCDGVGDTGFFWCADTLEPLETPSEFEPLSDTAIEGFFN